MTLAFFELSEWLLTLVSGEILTIYADSRAEDDGFHVFSLLQQGSPPTLRVVARVPIDVVTDITMHVGRTRPEGEAPGE